MTVHVGAEECLDRECDAYLDGDGELLDIDACPHLDTEQLCETHTTTDGNRVVDAEPWPCQFASASEETTR
jgi:hypothetical protein